jgi:hypothetical protein
MDYSSQRDSNNEAQISGAGVDLINAFSDGLEAGRLGEPSLPMNKTRTRGHTI